MTDGFTQMIDDSNAFFRELVQNNTKDWFNPRKAQYNDQIKKPAELFGSLLAEDFSRISGLTYKPKVFRIYRDVRFSKDKTPLKAHLHILFSPAGGTAFDPHFFFGSSPDDLRVGYGLMEFKGTDLARYRAMVDKHGDELTDAIEATEMTPSDWGPAPLKRVPTPYDKDHPHADLLKRKGLILSKLLDQNWRTSSKGLIGAVQNAFSKAQPFGQVLAEHGDSR
jgi:uncharacterized protein (TIGR02453 family)